MSEQPAIVVGAGVAGLCCAQDLQSAGRDVIVLEASDGVGGRVRTDGHEGFLLDRGFQVLLTAYPEARARLDLDALDLRTFEPGARVRRDGAFHEVVDPTRRPGKVIAALMSGIGSLSDKKRVLDLRNDARGGDPFAMDDGTTIDELRSRGFSEAFIDTFFRPWLGGIFLESELVTSRRMLAFVFGMFAEGDAALPARGMQAIPDQLAAKLAPDTVRTGTRVAEVSPHGVVLDDGSRLDASAVVVATDWWDAAALVGEPEQVGRRVRCVYYAADADPVGEPILVLDGEGRGPVNNLCVPSALSSHYAPPGAALISASVLGDGDVPEDAVRAHCRAWFGAQVDGWRHLRTYDIERALPDQSPTGSPPALRSVRRDDGVFVCGDHTEHGSLQGAMHSGARAAAAVLAR